MVVVGVTGLLSMVLMPGPRHHLPAPQQAKRLPPPAISLRSKSMTSELEEMGEPVGLLGSRRWGGRGAEGGLNQTLSLLVLLVTRGPRPQPVPQSMGQTLCGLRVCVAGKGRLRVDFPLSSYICFSVESLSGSARPSLRVPISFLASLHLPHLTPTPILYLFLHQLPHPPPTERKASPSPDRAEWTWGVPFPLTGGRAGS